MSTRSWKITLIARFWYLSQKTSFEPFVRTIVLHKSHLYHIPYYVASSSIHSDMCMYLHPEVVQLNDHKGKTPRQKHTRISSKYKLIWHEYTGQGYLCLLRLQNVCGLVQNGSLTQYCVPRLLCVFSSSSKVTQHWLHSNDWKQQQQCNYSRTENAFVDIVAMDMSRFSRSITSSSKEGIVDMNQIRNGTSVSAMSHSHRKACDNSHTLWNLWSKK